MILRKSVLSVLLIIVCAAAAAQTQTGKASFYSKRATGARTSSGERLHHDSLTCAHKTYPFGTLLKVTNQNNGKEVVVRVTDRGPHTRGRIIDLSWGAAKELGMLNHGVAMVRVEVVNKAHIPYRADPVEMPEIDFELTASGSDFLDAGWLDTEVKAAPNKDNRSKNRVAHNRVAKK